MILKIYKPNQGYWTRMLSAVGAGTLVLSGVAWLMGKLNGIVDVDVRLWSQTITAVCVVLVFGALLWWLLNKPRIVDFMIATEAEMRKVNWPSRREIILATWIVICGTLFMALMLWLFDLGFLLFFQQIGIIESGG